VKKQGWADQKNIFFKSYEKTVDVLSLEKAFKPKYFFLNFTKKQDGSKK
jgi:hypothetical protein